MRLLSLARVLFALLAFQLAVGLQPAIASAAVPQEVDSHAACPEHAEHSATDSAQPATNAKLSPHQPTHDPSSPLKHDCCKSSGCQCHCGNLPLAITSTAVRLIPDSSLIRPAFTTRSVSAPPGTLFRPPIAS